MVRCGVIFREIRQIAFTGVIYTWYNYCIYEKIPEQWELININITRTNYTLLTNGTGVIIHLQKGENAEIGFVNEKLVGSIKITKKIKSMRLYFKTGFIGNFFGHIRKAVQVRINYFTTLDTDHMWMGIRLIAVIAVASICKSEF